MSKKIGKKEFLNILFSVSLEMIVAALFFGGVFYLANKYASFCSGVFAASVGGIIGVMLALVSIYRRVRRYFND